MPALTAAHLVAEAKARTESVSPQQVAVELENGEVCLVDVREPEERTRQGAIAPDHPGAIHAPRGMLEFFADPTSAYYHPKFDPGRRTLLYCASGSRAALAADVLQRLGYAQVARLEGGLRAWRAAGQPVEAVS